jgi:hypothetical protein
MEKGKIMAITLSLLSLCLWGCSSESPKTVEYYVEHEKERTEKIADCKNKAISSQGEGVEAQNCRAARKAVEQKFFEHKPIMKKEYKGF